MHAKATHVRHKRVLVEEKEEVIQERMEGCAWKGGQGGVASRRVMECTWKTQRRNDKHE